MLLPNYFSESSGTVLMVKRHALEPTRTVRQTQLSKPATPNVGYVQTVSSLWAFAEFAALGGIHHFFKNFFITCKNIVTAGKRAFFDQ